MFSNEMMKRKSVESVGEDAIENMSEPNLKQIKTDCLRLSELTPNLEHLTDEPPNGVQRLHTETLEKNSPQEQCSISIKFHTSVVSDIYKSKFMDFINSFPEFQVQDESDFIIHIYQDVNMEQSEENVDDKTPLLKKRKKHCKVKKELFVVDATPSETTLQADLRYTTKFTISADKTGDSDACQSTRVGCFNCGNPHSLKDCLIPKDHARIALARQKYKFQAKSLRYHLEDQKYGHLEPGKISTDLRKALGLQKNEAPHFVYSMRKLGYPPGWLEEAKFIHSDLDLFDIDGNNVKSAIVRKQGLDESRVVDYPGFNVPFPKGVKDDYQMYRVPPYSEDFNKQAMVCFFQKQIGQHNLGTFDIDLEQELKPLVKPDRNSPSLVDLEQQKRQLLKELNEDSKDERKNINLELEKGISSIKTSCFGTPLLKSNSPFSSLPNADNFSKDVSPVINFENLPNSTGKYEQLTDVLQKVRDTMKRVNSS